MGRDNLFIPFYLATSCLLALCGFFISIYRLSFETTELFNIFMYLTFRRSYCKCLVYRTLLHQWKQKLNVHIWNLQTLLMVLWPMTLTCSCLGHEVFTKIFLMIENMLRHILWRSGSCAPQNGFSYFLSHKTNWTVIWIPLLRALFFFWSQFLYLPFIFLCSNLYELKDVYCLLCMLLLFSCQDVESELGLTRDKLIRMALLLGSDYTEGVR